MQDWRQQRSQTMLSDLDLDVDPRNGSGDTAELRHNRRQAEEMGVLELFYN